jgi:hypothetical protein
MSFEYYGAFKALNFLLENGATRDQAEAVSEAVIRHADLGETGTLTSLGMLIQLSTVFGKSTLIFVCYLLLHCLELRRRSKAFPDHWNVRLAFCLCTLSDLQTLGSLHNRRFGKRYRVHNLSRQCATSSYIVLRTHSTQAICTANFGDNFASNEKTLTIELVRDLLRMSNTTSPEVASVPNHTASYLASNLGNCRKPISGTVFASPSIHKTSISVATVIKYHSRLWYPLFTVLVQCGLGFEAV